jgi:hypothetical protein
LAVPVQIAFLLAQFFISPGTTPNEERQRPSCISPGNRRPNVAQALRELEDPAETQPASSDRDPKLPKREAPLHPISHPTDPISECNSQPPPAKFLPLANKLPPNPASRTDNKPLPHGSPNASL